jgi:hypothetical protein
MATLPAMTTTETGTGALAELAGEAPALHAALHRAFHALAQGAAGHETEGQRRRCIGASLTPLRIRLRACPDDARLLARWLVRHDHAILEEPAAWAREFPGLRRPAAADLASVADAAIGLPPLPGDEALLRECEARAGHHDAQRVIGHPSPYPAIRALARRLRLGAGEYLCDLGAGHGRVVLYLAHLGLPARGVELLTDRHAAAERARRAHRLDGARFDCGDVLDERFWRGPAAIVGAGWFYCYDPFDDVTDDALLARLRAVAADRPTRLAAFIQTSRYRDRYARRLREGSLRLEWPPAAGPDLGLHIFRVAP